MEGGSEAAEPRNWPVPESACESGYLPRLLSTRSATLGLGSPDHSSQVPLPAGFRSVQEDRVAVGCTGGRGHGRMAPASWLP